MNEQNGSGEVLSPQEHAHQSDGIMEEEVFMQEVQASNKEDAEKMVADGETYIQQFRSEHPDASEEGDLNNPDNRNLHSMLNTLGTAKRMLETKSESKA